jgi:hypothetical protein
MQHALPTRFVRFEQTEPIDSGLRAHSKSKHDVCTRVPRNRLSPRFPLNQLCIMTGVANATPIFFRLLLRAARPHMRGDQAFSFALARAQKRQKPPGGSLRAAFAAKNARKLPYVSFSKPARGRTPRPHFRPASRLRWENGCLGGVENICDSATLNQSSELVKKFLGREHAIRFELSPCPTRQGSQASAASARGIRSRAKSLSQYWDRL